MDIQYKPNYFADLKKNIMDKVNTATNVPNEAVVENIAEVGQEVPTSEQQPINEIVPTNDKISLNDNSSFSDIPLDCITEFKEHPFKIIPSNLNDLEESIKEYGVLTPITIRPKGNDSYEVLSGHHRLEACKNLGLATIPCNIVQVDDDSAKIIVINSNRQRGFTDMKPSEIAFALKMEYEALKSQGKRTDLAVDLEKIMQENQVSTTTLCDSDAEKSTSVPMEQKLKTSDIMTENKEMSSMNIRRYIRLTFLTSSLLQLVDDDKLGFRAGVELSFLSVNSQQTLLDIIRSINIYPNLKQATSLKELAKTSNLTEENTTDILNGINPNKKKKSTNTLPTTVKVKSFKQYIPANVKTQNELDEYLQKAVQHYNEYISNVIINDTVSDDDDDGYAELETMMI